MKDFYGKKFWKIEKKNLSKKNFRIYFIDFFYYSALGGERSEREGV